MFWQTFRFHRYDQGIFATAKLRIKDDFDLTDFEVNALVGSLSLCSAFGALISGWLCEVIGRRRTLIGSGCLEIAGALSMARANRYGTLLLGRGIMGFGIGKSLVASEVAPSCLLLVQRCTVANLR
jgi:MFS family permease